MQKQWRKRSSTRDHLGRKFRLNRCQVSINETGAASPADRQSVHGGFAVEKTIAESLARTSPTTRARRERKIV
jgi:hypothetical protein